ncbi:MAG: DUF4293 domain-containing protein [Chlorobi bacterium]|nr:DUF4293 domain-containing protein [Chlorobiota bacterium]
MLQRIQTLYMLIAVLASATFYYSLPGGLYRFEEVYYWGMVAITAVLFLNIFMYRYRQWQMRINRILMSAYAALVVLRIYEAFTSGGTPFSKKDVIWLIPVISIVFVKLANSAIERDENLVKSVDRIR